MLITPPTGTALRRIVVPTKVAVVEAFVAGKAITDIAQDTCIHKLRVEQVLREALIGLAALKVPQPVAPTTEPETEPCENCGEPIADPSLHCDEWTDERDGNPFWCEQKRTV